MTATKSKDRSASFRRASRSEREVQRILHKSHPVRIEIAAGG